MKNKIEHLVAPVLEFQIGAITHHVSFTMNALLAAEEKTGKNLKNLYAWLQLTPTELADVVEAAIRAPFAPGSMRAYFGEFTPEMFNEVQWAVCKTAFPKAVGQIEAAQAKGTKSPNE